MVSRDIEPLIHLLAQLKELIEKVTIAYQKLPHVLGREHRAIEQGILPEIETIGYEKETLVQEIADSVSEMMAIVREMNQKTKRDALSLKEALDQFNAYLLECLPESAPQTPLAPQVLKHLLKNTQAAAEHLEKTMIAVRPAIEANRDLVHHLMVSYGESYKFWQKLQEQVSSSYGADGTQKVVGRLSGFRARV